MPRRNLSFNIFRQYYLLKFRQIATKFSQKIANCRFSQYNVSMANKKTTSKKSTSKSTKAASASAVRTAAASAAKRAAKNNPKGFLIAVIALIMAIIVTALVLYFVFPTVWDSIFNNNRDADNGILSGEPMSFQDGDLSVHFINIGQGDSIYIIFPDGKDMLIDCGNKGSEQTADTAIDYLDMYNDDKQLDYMMLTHCDEDHVSFLDDVLGEYQVDNIFMPNVMAAPTKSNEALNVSLKKALNDNVEDAALFTDEDTINTIVYVRFFIAALNEPGCSIILNVDDNENINNIILSGSGYSLKFYCPTREYYADSDLSDAVEKNAICPIGVLEYKGYRVVLTGDSNGTNQPWLEQRIGGDVFDCDVLKIPHHGSKTNGSSNDEFLDYLDCEYAVICCGDNDTFPTQTVLDRLKTRNTTIYRTDTNGNIVLVINAKMTFYVQTEVAQIVNQTGNN